MRDHLRIHPSVITQIARQFFDGRYKAAAHCLGRLYKNGKIPYLTIVPREPDDRPTYLYAGWNVGNRGLHEYLLTVFAECFGFKGTWVRGARVNAKRRPDGEWNPGRFMNVELITGSQSERQHKERMEKYAGSTDPLLIVGHNVDSPGQTPELVIRLMSWGKSVDQIALYVMLDEVKKGGWDAQWADGGGHAVTLRQILGKTP